MVLIKFIALVISIWFTSVNIIKCCYGHSILPINFFIQAVAITTFIFIQFNLF